METNHLFKFTDYRAFLRAHFEDRKRVSKHWSYSRWAHELGLKATASLTMIINGQRDPGPKMTQTLSQYFSFKESQDRYFRALVKLGRANLSPSEKCEALEALHELSPTLPTITLDAKNFSAISKWYYYAIRQLGSLPEARRDPKWIQKRLRFFVPENEIQRALNTLLDLKLIQLTPGGRYTKTEGSLETTADVSSEAIKRYHEQVLELAPNALRQVPLEQREFGALTIAMNSTQFEQAKSLIRKFKNDMRKLASAQSGKDEVYQLQFQMFPMTLDTSKKRGLND